MNVKTKIKKETINFVIIVIVVLLIILIPLYLNFYFLKNKPFEERGTFGDMFGVVNSIFSGLAFAGIIISLTFQWLQIKSQNKDFSNTIRIQEKSSKALERQAENLKKTAILYALQAKLNYYTIEKNKNEIKAESNSNIRKNDVNKFLYTKQINECLYQINKILNEKINQ